MDKYVEFKVRREKESKNIILFIIFKEVSLGYCPNLADLILKEYGKYLKKYERFSIIVDFRKPSDLSLKLLKDKTPEALKYNDLAFQKVRSNCIIITSGYSFMLQQIIAFVKSLLPDPQKFVPYKFCSTNEEAMTYTKIYIKS